MAEIYCVDIETRPSEVFAWGLRDLSVGLSQIIRPGGLLMFAAQNVDSKKIESHAEWDGYEKMVVRSHEIYDEADYIVTFNGARFDNKHLRAAWAELGLPPPSPWRDIDLYKTVGQFQWPSRKLAFVCQQLGLDLKSDPGGFDTWVQILKGQDEAKKAQAQRRMVRYCRNDVAITTQLFHRLKPWISGMNVPLHSGGSEGDTSPGVVRCTRCGGENIQQRGWAYTTTYRYRRYCCTDCGGWMRAAKSEPLANTDFLRNA